MKLLHIVTVAVIATLSGLIGCSSALAAPQTKMVAAQAFLDASGFDNNQKAQLEIPNLGLPGLEMTLDAMKKNPEIQRLLNRASESLPKVREKVAEAYASKFESEELVALTTFFRTPVGQKYAALYPELQAITGKLLVEEALMSDPKISAALEADRVRKQQIEADRTALEQKANAGDPAAMYKLAATYCSRKDTLPQCFDWKLRAAKAGHPEAQFDIGFSFVDGRYGNQKNGVEMFRWIKRAAEQGHSSAAYYVGSAYAGNTKVFGNQATGVEISAKDAELWLQKAAKAGGMGAIMDLASMYLEGRVLERNIPQAIYWYSQAAEKRNTFAMRKLGEIYECGIGIEPNQQEAMKWYKQAAGVR